MVDVTQAFLNGRRRKQQAALCALAFAILLASGSPAPTAAADGPLSQLYWCPNRADTARIQVSPASDCEPLFGKRDPDRPPVRPLIEKPGVADHVEKAAQDYLAGHRQLMAAVVDRTEDPTNAELMTREEQATELLREMDAVYPSARYKGATVMSQNLVVALAEARQQLRRLRKERQALDQAREALDQMDYEASGRERQRIDSAQDKLDRELKPRKQPSRALTGEAIKNVPLTGPSYRSGQTKIGPEVGVSRFNDVSKTGPDSVGDSRFNEMSRTGPDPVGDSRFNDISKTGPGSVGNSRFNDISKTGPAAIGNSSTNDLSKTGQTIGDSDLNTRP